MYSNGSELSSKAETFFHYTYISSEKQLMVLDIRGVEYTLCDPEKATFELVANADNSIFLLLWKPSFRGYREV